MSSNIYPNLNSKSIGVTGSTGVEELMYVKNSIVNIFTDFFSKIKVFKPNEKITANCDNYTTCDKSSQINQIRKLIDQKYDEIRTLESIMKYIEDKN